MSVTPVKKPRTLEQAERLCVRWSALDAEIAAIEEARDVAIAAANAEVDQDLVPLLAQRAAITGKLEPWWRENSDLLTQGKRKSAELGGVVLQTREGRASVVLKRPEADVIAALKLSPSAAMYLRIKTELVKHSIALGLSNGGAECAELTAAGVALERSSDAFKIERTRQAGTPGKLGAKFQR